MFTAAWATTGAATLPDRSRSPANTRARGRRAHHHRGRCRTHAVRLLAHQRAAGPAPDRAERRVHVPQPEPDRRARDRAERGPRAEREPEQDPAEDELLGQGGLERDPDERLERGFGPAGAGHLLVGEHRPCSRAPRPPPRRPRPPAPPRSLRPAGPAGARRARARARPRPVRRPGPGRRARPRRRCWSRAGLAARRDDGTRCCTARPRRRPRARRRTAAAAFSSPGRWRGL